MKLMTMLSSLAFFLFLFGNVYATVNSEDIPTSAESAIISIQEADQAGADTSELIRRFNDALYQFETCSSNAECINNAEELFKSIVNDGTMLKDQANLTLNTKTVTAVICVLAASFGGSFVALYCYNKWKSYQLRRFLDMEIQAER